MRGPAVFFPDAEEIMESDSLHPSVCVIDVNFNRVTGPDETFSGEQRSGQRAKPLQSFRPQICVKMILELARNTGLRKQERRSVLFPERGTKPFCHRITEWPASGISHKPVPKAWINAQIDCKPFRQDLNTGREQSIKFCFFNCRFTAHADYYTGKQIFSQPVSECPSRQI